MSDLIIFKSIINDIDNLPNAKVAHVLMTAHDNLIRRGFDECSISGIQCPECGGNKISRLGDKYHCHKPKCRVPLMQFIVTK